MAKITTGQTYGTVDRRTSQRLTGGVELPSTPGPLAQREMAVPGLQPQANPVTSFFQPGAPTLGGPMRVPALPDLPQPSQDAAALAKALGGFSPALAGIAEGFIQREKAMDEERKQEATAFAFQAGKYGPLTGLADLQRTLERAAPTDAGAAKQLQYLLSRHPGMSRYLADAVQRQAILTNLGTLDNAARQNPLVDDGAGGQVRLDSLPTQSAAYQAWVRSHIYRDSQYSPQVLMETQQMVASVMGADLDRQEKAHIAQNMEAWRGHAANEVRSVAVAYRSGKMTAQAASQSLQALLDDQRLVGVDRQTREGVTQILWDLWDSSMGNGAQDNGPSSWEATMAPFAELFVGPVDQRTRADGTPNESLRLIAALGGESWLQKARQDHSERWLRQHNLEEQLQSVQVKDQVNGWLQELLPPGLIDSNPRLAEQRLETARQRVFSLPPNQQAAATSQIDTYYTNAFAAVNGREQQINQESYSRRLTEAAMDSSVAASLRAEIQRAMDNREVSQTWGQTQLSLLNSYGREDAKSYREAVRTLAAAMEQDWLKYARTSGSYDGGGEPSLVENQMLARAKALWIDRSNDVIKRGIQQGKSPDEILGELNKLFATNNFGLRKRTDDQTLAPTYANPEEWKSKNTGWFDGSGDPEKNRQLQRDARSNRPLYDAGVLRQQIDTVLSGGRLDDATKLMIKRAGMKPGEFFINELRKHGKLNGVDPDTLRRLQQLDQRADLVSSAPRPRPESPAQNPWLASIRALGNIGNTALNLATGAAPAQAAVMPGTGRYVAVTGFGYSADQQTQTLHGIQGMPGYDVRHGVGNDHVHHGARDNATALRLAQYLRYLGYPVTEFAQWRSNTGGHQDPGHGTGSSFDIPVPTSRHREVLAAIDNFYSGGRSQAAPAPAASTRRGGGMTGYATFYSGRGGSDGVVGGPTANGERYNPNAMTAAVQRSLRGQYLSKWLLVEDLDTGRTVRVWANDVGSMGGTDTSLNKQDPRIIDLSPAAFRRLFGDLGKGKGRIRVKIDPVQSRRG